MSGDFRVSVGIIARNEDQRITRCLEALVSPPPKTPFEILVLDNASSDGTDSRVREFFERHPGLAGCYVRLEANHLGKARAEAVRRSRGDLVAFTDADCIVPSGWIDGLAAVFAAERSADPKVIAVGSGNIPPDDSPLHTLFSSFLGNLGTIQARPRSKSSPVNHLPTCNVLYDRALVLSIGNFSGRFARVCEDLEISHRARRVGYRMIYVPGLEVVHDQRAGLCAWAEKMFRYGRGQIRVARHHPSHLIGLKGVPLFCFVGAAALAFARPVTLAALALTYAAFFVCHSFRLAARENGHRPSAFRVAALFFITHSAYAAGEAFELVMSFGFRPDHD